jgi:hypothetical protein
MINNIESSYAIFTVCNLAYLPKALVLAESVLKFNGTMLNIFLIEKKVPVDLKGIQANFIWIEDLNIEEFYELAFKYDIIELSTSLKPYITLELLKRFNKVIFLDPDTCMYHSALPILNYLDDHAIVLTPHYTTPQSNDLSESDVGMMRFGAFNLGFYAVKKSDQATKFLEWWSIRCFNLCFMESQFGLSTDQKWVSIAPCLFEGIYVSFNLGLNVSAWNSYERVITKNLEGNYFVNENQPLIFFHFSNFNSQDPEYMQKRSIIERNIRRPDFLELGLIYRDALISKETDAQLTKYGFDYMSDGQYISPTLRRAYACIKNELPKSHDPFNSDGVVGDFAKKNFLFERKESKYKTNGYADIANNKLKLKIIYFIMRCVLKFVGPNKFQNLSRLMVYLSSYRQNRGLWKL